MRASTSTPRIRDGCDSQDSDDCIYARGAPLYWEAGWRAPLPFPPGAKSPPLKGWTGYDGRWPDEEQIDQWARERPRLSNLGNRLYYGQIGIDVDAYDAKTGDLTLKEAESRWGPLPPTYRSSSRIDDDVSGIRVFRAPVGVLFRGKIGFPELGIGDIETIQPHLRVVIAWPSIHPKTGQHYRWFGPDGTLLPEGQVPRVEDLAELPEAWVTGLSRDSVREEVFDGSAPNRPREEDAVVDEEVYYRLAHLVDNGMPDAVVTARLEKAFLELTYGSGSRYDTTRDHVAALMRFHSWGRVGVPRALAELFSAYVMEVADTRPRRVAEGEFKRFTEGAALLVAATPPSDPWSESAMRRPAEDGAHAPPRARMPQRVIPLGVVSVSPTCSVASGSRWCPRFLSAPTVRLLYPGLVHSIHGESESGKSLIVQAECVRLLNRRQDVLYVDFDSDAASVVERLLDFGADPQLVDERFIYLQPEVRPDSVEERRAWEEILSGSYALAVIDGVTDALGVFGLSTNDNDDVARWIRGMPKLIAARTGAAVVLIDHVTKDASNRNRFAIGGQAKMAGLTGAAYTVEVTAPLGRGLRGEVVLKIGKDRPGAVREHCGSFSKKDRTQEAARIVVDSTVEPPTVIVEAPEARSDETTCGPRPFRPTNLMQRASQAIEQHSGELTKNKVAKEAGGNKQATLAAIDILREEGYVTTTRGRLGHDVYESVNPYREKDDPLSDGYVNLGNASHSD